MDRPMTNDAPKTRPLMEIRIESDSSELERDLAAVVERHENALGYTYDSITIDRAGGQHYITSCSMTRNSEDAP